MSDEDWDVEKYRYLRYLVAFTRIVTPSKLRNQFEPEEQWELKKKFMETHKGTFPEDRVVCLAQVLVNIEFLGTKYDQKTRILTF